MAVCDKHQAVWSGLVGFAGNYAKFKAAVQIIEDSARDQDQRSGAGAEKMQRRTALVDRTLIVAGAVGSYASDQGDLSTVARVSFSRTDLLGGRDSRTAERCESIHLVATRAGTGLAGYLADAPVELEALKNACAALRQSLAKPSEVRAVVKALTRKISDAFVTAAGLLDGHLDKLVPQLRAKAADFVAEYAAARTVINNTGPSAAQPAPVPPTPAG